MQVCRGKKFTGHVRVSKTLQEKSVFYGRPIKKTNREIATGSSHIPFDCSVQSTTLSNRHNAMTTSDSDEEVRVETDGAGMEDAEIADVACEATSSQDGNKTVAEHLDEDDFLVLHSTYAGSPAIRDPKSGSWFIQNLCRVLDSKTQPFSLVHALSDVQKNVAINEGVEVEHQLRKQMPVVYSTLTKSLMIVPKPVRNVPSNPTNK